MSPLTVCFDVLRIVSSTEDDIRDILIVIREFQLKTYFSNLNVIFFKILKFKSNKILFDIAISPIITPVSFKEENLYFLLCPNQLN